MKNAVARMRYLIKCILYNPRVALYGGGEMSSYCLLCRIFPASDDPYGICHECRGKAERWKGPAGKKFRVLIAELEAPTQGQAEDGPQEPNDVQFSKLMGWI